MIFIIKMVQTVGPKKKKKKGDHVILSRIRRLLRTYDQKLDCY